MVSSSKSFDDAQLNNDGSPGTGTDTLAKEKRSQLMSRVRHKGTKPESAVRALLDEMELRFQLNRTDLPGSPDVTLPEYRTVIFVHGCFWHRHPNCKKATTPKQNAQFWKEKFERNIERDAQKVQDLEALGWRVVTIWQCETEKIEDLTNNLRKIFKDGGKTSGMGTC